MTHLKIFLFAFILIAFYLAGYYIGNKSSHYKYYVHPIGAKLWYYMGANAYQKAIYKSENTDELIANIQADFERDSLANF